MTVTGLRQHQAWRARELPPVEQLAPELWSIPVPIPHSPLRYVSCYVLGTDAGPVLIDAGWDSPDAWSALQAGLARAGSEVSEVRGLLVTHMHFDHVGLATRVREASGAWVAMHPADTALISRPDYRDPRQAVEQEAAFMRRLGAPEREARALVGTSDEYEPFTRIALPDRPLVDGELVDVPGWKLRAVHTPGHTPGHVCFHDERWGRFFSGDHVLPRITPNISVERGGDQDPLGDYLDSLEKVGRLGGADEVLPAHEWRFQGLGARASVLRQHHDQRLAELLQAVRSNPGSTPWELASELTWSRPWPEYDGRMRIFAVTETASHLFRLLAQRKVRQREAPVPTYTAA